MVDLIVIGAGTAGLTAAIYGVRAGLSVTVIEKMIYGGQIITSTSVENYPGMPGVSGADFATALYEQAVALGAELRFETATGVKLSGDPKVIRMGEKELAGKSVVIATGASPRKLGIPGEDRLAGAGVSYCATCDGNFHRGKDVAVVGGGNTALEDALILSGVCRKVYLIHRSGRFRAEQHAVDRLQSRANVEWLTDSVVDEITGEKAVSGALVRNLKDGSARSLELSGLFVAVGSVPDNGLFAGELALDSGGYVIADESCVTNLPGVFVAGDTRTKKVRQIVTAAADGAVAALAASEYLSTLEPRKG